MGILQKIRPYITFRNLTIGGVLAATASVFAISESGLNIWKTLHSNPTSAAPVGAQQLLPASDNPTVIHNVEHKSSTIEVLDGQDNLTINRKMLSLPEQDRNKLLDELAHDIEINEPGFNLCVGSKYRIMNATDEYVQLLISEYGTDNYINVTIGPGERWLGDVVPGQWVVIDDNNRFYEIWPFASECS